MATNDNYITALAPIADCDLPDEYKGRVTVIIEIRDGDTMKINGLEFTLADGARMLEGIAKGEVE